MKNDKSSIMFFIPLVIAILSFGMKAAMGPYWLGPNNDPAYMYLINFLYILDQIPPKFVQHPGMTLQMLGAGVVKILNPHLKGEAIVENVFRNPEYYLTAVHYVLLTLFLLSLFFVGYYTYKKTNDIFCGICMQLPAFIFLTLRSYGHDKAILPIITNVDAEPLLITIVNIFILCLLRLYFRKGIEKGYLSSLLFGLTCGFALATKASFLPFLLIPLVLLNGLRVKAFFMLTTISFFLFLISPGIKNYHYATGWWTELAIRKYHGQGDVGFDAPFYLQEFSRVFRENVFLFFVVIGSLIVVLWNKLKQKRLILDSTSQYQLKANGYLFVVSLTGLLFFFFVAKHPAPHYMASPLGLMGIIVFLIYNAILGNPVFKRRIFIAFLFIFIMTTSLYAIHYQKELLARNRDIYNFSQMVYSKYKDCIICGYYRSSSPEFALQFGDDNAGNLAYNNILRKVYPHAYYFHYWTRWFHDGLNNVLFSQLKKMNDCILIYGSQYHHEFQDGFLIAEKIESSATEDLYLVKGSTIEGAMQSYMLSQYFLKQQEYQKAYEFALKAKALGVPRIDDYIKQLQKLMLQRP